MEGEGEGKGAYNFKEQTVEAVSELKTMHADKMSKIKELKGKKEAMELELEKKKKENPEKIRDFEDLSGIYGSKRDQLFAKMAEKSQVKGD